MILPSMSEKKSILDQSVENIRPRCLHNLRLCLLDLAHSYLVSSLGDRTELRLKMNKDCMDIIHELIEISEHEN